MNSDQLERPRVRDIVTAVMVIAAFEIMWPSPRTSLARPLSRFDVSGSSVVVRGAVVASCRSDPGRAARARTAFSASRLREAAAFTRAIYRGQRAPAAARLYERYFILALVRTPLALYCHWDR